MNANTSSNLKHLLHVIAIAIVSATVAMLLMGQRTVSKEQYRVLNVIVGENPMAFQTELNSLGDQGWKVRSSVGNWIVLAADR
jgi:hypothetical protein